MQTIVKLTLSEQIYDILKNDILIGQIRMGDKLTNRELQERFQVSSTPVRDAINKLYQDGLVQEVTKTGAQVISFDLDYTEEINEYIALLSCQALLLSSSKAHSEPVYKTLGNYVQAMIRAENDEEYFEADFRFHKTFFDYSDNRFLKDTYKRYNLIRFLMIHYAIRTEDHRSLSIQQHQEITAAYAKGDYQLAQELLKKHYQYGMVLIQEYNSNHP